MEAYVPSTIKSFPPAKPWFDRDCSRSVQTKERAHASYEASRTEFNHTSFKAARNHCTSHLRRKKHLFVKRKTSNTVLSLTEKSFWSLANKVLNNFCKSNFPPLIRTDGSIAITPSEKANLFGSLFSANSSVDDSKCS